ncbi:LamG domain-containing protein [Coraliomargarita sp. W4R53]
MTNLGQAQSAPGHTQASEAAAHSSLDPRDYSFGFWRNGFRKNPTDSSADILSFETGYYGFSLNLADLPHAQFGLRPQAPSDYQSATLSAEQKPNNLKPAELLIQLGSSGKVFTATRSVTGPANVARRLEGNRLWESGRYLQHFDLQHVAFEDNTGTPLSCDARLSIVAWPKSLTINAEITPTLPFTDGASFGLVGNAHNVVKEAYEIPHTSEMEAANFTLEAWIKVPRDPATPNSGALLSKNGTETDDGHIGFYLRGNRVSAVMNLGGNHRGRTQLFEERHKTFKFDEWNHLAISYDGETMFYYVNGRLENSQKVGKIRKPSQGSLWLGGTDATSKQNTYASFDQIRIWDRALSEDEIETHDAHPEALSSKQGLRFEKTFDTSSDPAPIQYLWKNVNLRIQLKSQGQTWEARSPLIEQWEVGKMHELTLNCEIIPSQESENRTKLQLTTSDGQDIPVVFDPSYNAHVAEVRKLKRKWKTGYTDIRNYDDFAVTVENPSNVPIAVPFMLYLRDVANITGLCPILCDENGVPTGIPMQLSKNWHYGPLGAYLRTYALLPAQPGTSTYTLRIVYGFYGTLPSASHAQLSLIGYGGNGRWDQLAIGSWGETICFDVNRSLVDVAITDVRMLMARIGADGKKWTWTDAGWGGDWLQVLNDDGLRHHPNDLRTAYLAHGPCLTDARYSGAYGDKDEVRFDAQVNTLRTDDYARTFQTFHYTFEKEVTAKGAWLFKMGRTSNYATPKFAYGNADGLIADEAVPSSLKRNENLLDQVTLEGSAPWWVSFPGAYKQNENSKGNGYRALVIRSYKANLGGKVYTNPSISVPVYQVLKDGAINLDLLLTAPKGVTSFRPGDTIDMELEWITLHREADDYYGPNESYRQHLIENPSSWKTTYREAIGNDLKVQVKGGSLLNRYPIKIQAQPGSAVEVTIEGGVGYVPIQFRGLASATGMALYQVKNGRETELDQSVHGNDFWQTDYDAATGTYQRTYNLPLDGLKKSSWVLKQ